MRAGHCHGTLPSKKIPDEVNGSIRRGARAMTDADALRRKVKVCISDQGDELVGVRKSTAIPHQSPV